MENPVDPFHILDNFMIQSASLTFCTEFNKSIQSPERRCDRVARCRLDRSVPSSLIGGNRLLNTLLSVMLSMSVLTNELWIA